MSATFGLASVILSQTLRLCWRRKTHWIQKHGCFQMCTWTSWDIPCTGLLSFPDQDPLSIFSRDSIQRKALQKLITKAALCPVCFLANTSQATHFAWNYMSWLKTCNLRQSSSFLKAVKVFGFYMLLGNSSASALWFTASSSHWGKTHALQTLIRY